MTLREASPADLAAIAEIQAASPEASSWNPADYLNYDCRVAVVNDELAGFIATRTIAGAEHEILNIAIAPKHRRSGIARTLVASAIARQPGTWFLEVRESNHAAINLYSAIGFAIVGRRPEYYTHPSEPGIVMRILS